MKVEDLSSQGAWSGLSALGFVVVLSEWWQSWAELQPVCQRGPQTCSVPLEIIFFFGSVTNTIHICLKKKKPNQGCLQLSKSCHFSPCQLSRSGARWGWIGLKREKCLSRNSENRVLMLWGCCCKGLALLVALQAAPVPTRPGLVSHQALEPSPCLVA